MKTFKIYKPADECASFLEVERSWHQPLVDRERVTEDRRPPDSSEAVLEGSAARRTAARGAASQLH